MFTQREINYIDEIKRTLGEKEIDVITEMLTNVNVSNYLKLLSYREWVIDVSNRSSFEINPWDTMAKESSISGVVLLSPTKEEFQQFAAALQVEMEISCHQPMPMIGS